MMSASLSSQLAESRQGGAEDRGLSPAGAVRGAFEQVGADLLEGELEQVRPLRFNSFAHVSGLTALPGKEQRKLSVASHLCRPSLVRAIRVSRAGHVTPRSGGYLHPMLRLYRAPFSTNVERVALALAFKGLEAESVVISYEDRSPVEEVSGQGLVPVLVDGDEVVRRFHAGPALSRAEVARPATVPARRPRDAATSASSSTGSNEVWKRGADTIGDAARALEPRPGPRSRPCAELDAATRSTCSKGLLDGRDHLFGDDFSAADCAAFPFLKYGKVCATRPTTSSST